MALETDGNLDEREAQTTRRKPGRPRLATESARKAKETRDSQLSTVGKLLSACPMTPDELAETWCVAADDAETITVKIQRFQLGTRDLELVASVPMTAYSGEWIAGKFGPGTYYLRPAAGPYGKHSAKLPISEALARSAGWGRVTPTASELVAERTIRQAATGPTDPMDLVAAIEAVMDRRDRERGIVPQNQGVIQPVDPISAVKAQFEQIQTMMGFMASLEERAIKTVEMRMGKADVSMGAEDTNVSLWEKLLPKALDIFGAMMQNRGNAAPAPVPAAQPVHQVIHQAAPGAAAAAQPSQPTQPEQEAVPMPELTDQEKAAIGAAVAALSKFAEHLVGMTDGPATDRQIVDGLEPWIPPGMVPSLEALANVVAKHGPNVLATIHPRLASDRWAGILPQLVAACNS